jgi:cysteine desulfurase/selenocysteine lyase
MQTTEFSFKNDFPTLNRVFSQNKPLVYLDSAATSQKPNMVIDAMNVYYQDYNANIHRGIHKLAEEATLAYETARKKIAHLIGAKHARELIFTRNTTESINLIANSWGRANLKRGDLVILTEMEHHSNLVPWHMLGEELGLRLEFIPININGTLNLDVYKKLLEQSPRLVSFTHMSNVLGTINPAKEIIKLAHEAGAVTIVDGAQSVPHFPVDVIDLDADFVAFSAHKMAGPTGIGGLYGKEQLLDAMPPFLGGGSMIRKVNLRSFVQNDLPDKFEAGTPAIAEAIGFGAAVDYLNTIGMDKIAAHEIMLNNYALESLDEMNGIHVFGPGPEQRGGVISFSMDGAHPHDIAQILDSEGVAVRAGHHCSMPLHEILNVTATTRASFYLYNSREDIDQLVKALQKVKTLFKI